MRLALALALFAAAGCTTLIGADDPTLRGEDASVSSACVLNSDCTTAGQFCIFRVCSPPCHTDSDCVGGSRCLRTQVGTACVTNVVSMCDEGHSCPAGSTCENGLCRNTCGAVGDCLPRQQCVAGGICIGTDPVHDPGLDAGQPDASVDQTSGDVSAVDAPSEVASDAPDAASDGSAPADAPVEGAGGVCNAGARQCNAQQPQVCGDGGWANDGPPCQFACDPSTGCQGACVPNSKQCMSNGLQTCGLDGKWGAPQACPFVCSAGQCTGVCLPGDKQCNGSTPQTCGNDGQWASGTACPSVCSAGACAGSCVVGTMQCSSNIPQTCAPNGTWTNGTTCPFVCNSGTCTGVCVPNDTQCSSGTQQTCNALGQWASATTCPYVCTGKVCGGVCVPNDTQCSSGTQQQTCNASGQWASATTCPYVCTGKVCGGVCVPNDTQCSSGTQQQTCNATGQWGTASTCMYVCTGRACAGVCTPTNTRCTSTTQTEVCGTDATWGAATTCTYACVGNTCGGSCVPGSMQCDYAAEVIQSCDNTGTWVTQTACTGGMPLCRSNACVASTQYDYGNSAKLADANTESANYLTVQQITVNYRTSLLRFGVWGRDAIHTPNVVMAIYADSGGTPGAFVASSIPVAIASGAVEAPVGSATNLMPGKYWIGGVYSATADTSWSMSSGPTAYYVMDTYPATPNPFPTAGRMTFTGYTYNYYIVVQDY